MKARKLLSDLFIAASFSSLMLALNLSLFSGAALAEPVCSRPNLALEQSRVYWADFADFTGRQLSIEFLVQNKSAPDAFGITAISASGTNGVTAAVTLPLPIGDAAAGADEAFTVTYNVPAGVAGFVAYMRVTASDSCANAYEYPQPGVTDGFSDSGSWSVYDIGAPDVLGVKSFHNAVFDGRYIYCVPGWDGVGMHGMVARYDTKAIFSRVSSWSVFDFEIPLFSNTCGPISAVFDGRYIYFVPNMDDTFVHNGRVIRFDTASSFEDPSSWSIYDAGYTNGLYTRGYVGAVYDGRYVYFSPHNNTHGPHGNVLRYDTAGSFNSPNSWSAYDAGNTGGLITKGYGSPVFDGRYVYFSPKHNAEGPHGNVLRYDTAGSFTSPSSWSAHNAGGTAGLNISDCGGFGNSIFDGRFVYFGSCGGEGYFLRYEVSGNFSSPDSWSAFDASNSGGLTDTKGYSAAAFDGRYIYYAPYGKYSSHHGKALRYDTAQSFLSASSWSAFDMTSMSPSAQGYQGAVFDGRYMFFIPDDNLDSGIGPHGNMVRYDTGSYFSAGIEGSAP